MWLTEDVKEEITEIQFFKNVGNELNNCLLNNCLKVNGKNSAIKLSSNLRFQNYILSLQNKLSVNIYKLSFEKRQEWNEIADEINIFLDGYFLNYTSILDNNIKNILRHIFIIYLINKIYNKYIGLEIEKEIKHLINIYRLGHIPCGCVKKKGKYIIKVY